MPNSVYWQTASMRLTLELLAAGDGPTHQQTIMAELRDRLKPSGDDLDLLSSRSERWWNTVKWATTDMTLAGWMTKANGNWSITDEGRAALDHYSEPAELRMVAKKRYRDVRAAAAEAATRRAWLVRGSSVLGMNLVPEWLEGGWCSLAASQLGPITGEMGRAELVTLAEAAYEHLKHQERQAKVGEIVDFALRMKAGDVVLTTSDEGAFVGDVVSDVENHASDGGRSNLRRRVRWRNPDAGVDFGALPGPLQAKLKTGSTVADLTGELASIDALTQPALEDDDEVEDVTPSPMPVEPHEAFGPLPDAVAEKLFVSADWLAEFVELLNEQRQLVLYGPPGTGKTYLARKIAAHLVSEQRVRLVQFHPSYTYEDFFEGFRPSNDEDGGTVRLELRWGPLRRLANEAKDHPEQAFILVIDELNRANIAKVFGELYFLLEYRDQAVEVLYGGEPFTLPTNLYFVCTMNTADRSIALLDAAMRRRFAFLELHPATEPTASTLGKWLASEKLPPTAATLLSLLNGQLDDRETHVGPSYFMASDQSRERLARIWRTQIAPLLQEVHYDRWATVAPRFDFDSLYAKALGATATPLPPPDPESVSDQPT